MPLPENSTSKIGKKGVVVIPAYLRRRFGLEEGSLIITEETAQGILIRPAVALPIEIYTSERRAEFLLSNATNEEEYQAARSEVIAMGLNPDEIQHHRP
ncbi:MAG: AbrB/MazE/SpoVT family DNA-binding domain-containing protein [Desmonostoc vinosum HA7617-LM4]|jgi:AbrB family looped-hinge helix DNA binding protein|nr:AbrB/MazE/SpoVT family DNA-binding domain-containing protein [Desmonostoc vinosum HA7617-LM4]